MTEILPQSGATRLGRRARWIMAWLVSVGGVAAAYWTLTWFAQRSVMFPGPLVRATDEARETSWLKRVSLGPDGRWEALHLLPSGTAAAPTILFAHGNGELTDSWVEPFSELQRLGYGVVLVEYPGYGRSPGTATRASVGAAMMAAYDYAAGHPRVDRARLIGYGRSLGGAAIAELSLQRPLAALVLESTFTSVRDIAARYGIFGPLVRDPFDSRAALTRFKGPVLLLHGERDRIIPASHSRALARVVPGAELALLPCGHNDCARPWPRVLTFLSRHQLGPVADEPATTP